MPLARFYQLVRVAHELKREEERSELEKIAWQSWQISLPHMSKALEFEKWKEMVGLKKADENEVKMTPQEALDHAMKIMKSDKKRRIKA